MLRVSFYLAALLAVVLAGNDGERAVPVTFQNLSVPKQLKVGDSVELELQLTNNIRSFSVNLVSEFDSAGYLYNVNYHHRFDPSENRVLLTSRINGVWQDNTAVWLKTNPIGRNDRFKMRMYLGQDGIYTSVKNQLSFYAHKIPLSDIKWVTIVDDHLNQTGSVDSIESIYYDFA